MTVETLLTRTKDNCVIAFTVNFGNAAEKTRLKHECENLCRNLNYNEFNSNMLRSHGISFDADNTNFLHKEISGYHYRKDRANFRNDMRTDPPAQTNTLSLSYRLTDDEFPEMLKNLGFKITPVDKTYNVRYNPSQGKFEAENFVSTTATVYSDDRKIEIVRNHFRFSSADYRRLNELKNDFFNARQSNPHLSMSSYVSAIPDLRDRALFDFYAREKSKVDNRRTTIAHEIKHIKNAVLRDGLNLKSNNKRLSVENYYRIAVENERSAYLEELVQNINEYLQKGNYNDFSMFYVNNADFVAELKRLRTPAERLAYVRNWPQLLAAKMRDFNSNYLDKYFNQFKQITESSIENAPLNAQPDNDDAEFKKLRSLFYNYQIYNPASHSMESVNLADYLTADLEISINDRVRREIIEPQQNCLNRQLSDFASDKAAGNINPELIEPAKALMRGGLQSSEFINEVDNFRVSSLYEDDGNSFPQPTAPSIPSDHAQWSNNLQQYWSNTVGYTELAKNNEEYKFKINGATVRYSSDKDVQVSQNANYQLYVKLLNEPSKQNAPIEFLETLRKEQKLLLYIACINNGRKPIGAVPTDFSDIENLQGIAPAEINKFRHRMQQQSGAAQNANAQSTQTRAQKMCMQKTMQNTR